MARTLCAPTSVIGPTVNWNGLPTIGSTQHIKKKVDTPQATVDGYACACYDPDL